MMGRGPLLYQFVVEVYNHVDKTSAIFFDVLFRIGVYIEEGVVVGLEDCGHCGDVTSEEGHSFNSGHGRIGSGNGCVKFGHHHETSKEYLRGTVRW